MTNMPTYEELEQRVRQAEEEAIKLRHTDEALRASEEKYRTVLEGIEDGYYEIIRKDGVKRILEMSVTLIRDSAGEATGFRGIVRDSTERKHTEKKLKETLGKLRKGLEGTIQAMALTVEIRDPYTAGHQRRVANLARAVAEEMGVPEKKIDGIRMAGIIHDLGKVPVPAEILNKPGRLNEHEFAISRVIPK